ncbi:Eukaryotic translation initiation factor 3 subunit K [Hondaea fermentalgiana]|uniref:Eukaryotic translation initiation factor 3 subunit K n=1 Tax=Hondaea fermentalgiana TaxID=2315210 RepID=A0A2R5GMP8_9STRA|nr:Eukaryotic translation initiation factor 3 subunit K [Hondaea fermentalgiana]|eukprot:GBG31008.1 Eukaryotic translation initiation factor 3 subunit K [Hondaea fermentalgiana]
MINSVDAVEAVLKENLEKRTKSSSNPERTLLKQFKQIDVNHDGCISFVEFRRALEPFTLGTPETLLKGLFERWDVDGSGNLSLQEFVQALFKSPAEREAIRAKQDDLRIERQESSVLAEDIIEQAKRRRAARKSAQTNFLPTSMRQRHAESVAKSAPEKRKTASQRRGPFRAAEDEKLDAENSPETIRYRVSNSWVSAYTPSNWNANETKRSGLLPEQTLDLEFVYGCNPRAGLIAKADGELVYAAAGLGIVYDPRKHEQRFFRGHTDDVTCIAVDPSQKYAATGCMGKNPQVHVWDLATMQIVGSTPAGFYERRITALAFSQRRPDVLIAIGGDNHHMLGIWEWTTGRILAQAPAQNGTPPQITAIVVDDETRSGSEERFVTCGFKHTKFWSLNLETGKLSGGKNGTYGKVTPQPRETRCAAFLAGGKTLVTGGSNGVMYLWDATSAKCKRAYPAHDGPVLAVLVAANHQLISAGAKDARLTYWSTESASQGAGALVNQEQVQMPTGSGAARQLALLSRGKASPVLVVAAQDGSLRMFSSSSSGSSGAPETRSSHSLGPWKTLVGGHAQDLYGLGAHPQLPGAFCTVGEDRRLIVWDATSRQLVQSIDLPAQARSVDICADPNGRGSAADRIAVGFKDGSFAVLDARTYEILHKAKHCTETIDDIRFSPDGRLLAVASHDNFIDVYLVQEGFKHLARCKGHSSYVTHIDWSADSRFLQSNSGSYETLVWDAVNGRIIPHASRIRDMEWASFSCVLGFDVMGIWPHGSDGTDVNAVARSPDHRLIVTGDDFGNVNLYNYPCLVGNAPHHALTGHSSHVMNTRWLADGSRETMGDNEMQKAAKGLLETDRYNKEILPELTQCVQAQVDQGWYDLEINTAILKLYQFHPDQDEGVVDLDVLLKILALALMQLPAADFKLCLYLVPSQYHLMDSVSQLTKLAEKLEGCQFTAFWQLLEKRPEVLAVVPGLEDALRKTIFQTVALTHQEIPKKALAEYLNYPVGNIAKDFGIEAKEDRFVMPASPGNQPKPSSQSTGPAEVQFPQLTQALAHSLF